MIGQWTADWAKNNNFSCQYIDSCTSTNDLAKALPQDQFCSLFVTNQQTAGRGRGTNRWENAPMGSQLLSSWVFDVSSPPQPTLSPILGLGLYKALKWKWPEPIWNLKKPNDIYINNKKVGGILAEIITFKNKHRLIIGLGLNILSHPQIPIAGSIQTEISNPIDIESWYLFLKRLQHELQVAANSSYQVKINSLICAEICQALNLNPSLKTPYIKMLPDGSLVTPSGTIPWSDI